MSGDSPSSEASFIAHTRRTVGGVLEEQANRLGDKTFMTFVPTGRRYSYRELDAITSDLALRLVGAGVSKGDRVVLFMDNSPEMVFLLFALAKAGAIAAPVNTAAKGKLLEYHLGLADPVAVVTDMHLLELVEPAAAAQGVPKLVVLGADPGSLSGAAISFDDLMAAAVDPSCVLPEVHYSDVCMLMFTSGTTGPSKAIMYTQAHALFWGGDVARHSDFIESDVEYTCLPLFHGNSTLNCTYGALMAGTSIVLTNRFSVTNFWDDIRGYGVTRFLLIGAMVNFLWSRDPGPEDRDHQVRIVSFAPTPKFAVEFMERFGVKALSGFGLTDFGLATILAPSAPSSKLFSVGVPRSGVTVKIFDDYDNELPPGEIGEMVLRSDNPWGFAIGYFRNAEATVAANRNQWFHTGDNGYIDDDGYVYFMDRKKDAIRRRGENISAFEVEDILALHPAVQQASVYAVQSDLAEDEVAASIILRPDASSTFEEIILHCVDNMAYFMVPRYLEFVEWLPKTPSEKVQKVKLRERAQQDPTRLWDREAAGIVVKR